MEVFYNPIMKFNRDMSIFLLNSVDDKEMQIGSPLAGTGVREVRMLKELDDGKVKNLSINDISDDAVKIIRQNLEINSLLGNADIYQKDANLFLLESTGFDYIDIDPFGSPNPFLNSAIARISREGILAVTATDTSALSGTYPDACERKYWAKPLKNELMHEIGLRILIRKIQLVGMNYEKALIPIFSYSKDHYMRIFFRCKKSKEECNKVSEQHRFFLYCKKCMNMIVSEHNSEICCDKRMEHSGPIWTGNLHDNNIVANIEKLIPKDYYEKNFFSLIVEESGHEIIGFIDMHTLSKKYKINPLPKIESVIDAIRKRGKFASRTHFLSTAIKSDMHPKEIAELMKEHKKEK
jgi:tRNA (guanine26-N2/guanine27-N2)-dimethyltransferase